MEKKSVLIVEDNESMRTMLKQAFEKRGFSVETAADGEQAIGAAKHVIPDVLLLDVILPKKDGFDVIREIRENEATKNVPIILLTNLESSEHIEKALSLGATTYLVKANYTLEEIVEKVKTVLQ